MEYPGSRVSFDLPRKIGKVKEALVTGSTIPTEHAPLAEPPSSSRFFWEDRLSSQVSFEQGQGDFRISVHISLVYGWYKMINFVLHYSIPFEFFGNFNFPEKCSRLHSNAGHKKGEFDCLFYLRKYCCSLAFSKK